MKEHVNRYGAEDYVLFLLLVPLTVLLVVELAFSLSWRMVQDTPLLHYVAFLIDTFDRVPYKDIFETSLPGAFLFHLFVGKLFGYGDLAHRWINLLWLLALSIVTWNIMKSFGVRVAWASVVLFDLSYLQFGPGMSLQRDCIGILPVATAVLVTTSRLPRGPTIKGFLIGVLFGLSATIKPHLAIGLPVMLLYMLVDRGREARGEGARSLVTMALGVGLSSLIGLAIPIAASLLWVWKQGGLLHFWEMVSSYLPLHVQLTGRHETVFGIERVVYLLQSYRELGGLAIWLGPLCLGLYMAFSQATLPQKEKRLAVLLFSLTVVYSLYPVLAGQFWEYHWMPFQYFLIMSASLALIPSAATNLPRFSRLFPVCILALAIVLGLRPAKAFLLQATGQPPWPWKDGRIDEMVEFFKEELRPGDTVQPLDWVCGAVHAMLLAKARVATPFIHDYHFYHHVSNPYIKLLRKRFIERLEEEKPRFIVDVTDKHRVRGEDTTEDFPELQRFIDENYVRRVSGKEYVIYERRKGEKVSGRENTSSNRLRSFSPVTDSE